MSGQVQSVVDTWSRNFPDNSPFRVCKEAVSVGQWCTLDFQNQADKLPRDIIRPYYKFQHEKVQDDVLETISHQEPTATSKRILESARCGNASTSLIPKSNIDCFSNTHPGTTPVEQPSEDSRCYLWKEYKTNISQQSTVEILLDSPAEQRNLFRGSSSRLHQLDGTIHQSFIKWETSGLHPSISDRSADATLLVRDDAISVQMPGPDATPRHLKDNFEISADNLINKLAVPGTKPIVWLYQVAQFPPEVRERFEVVANILKTKVAFSELKHCMKSIIYDLRVCASDQAHQSPTVVIFCPRKTLKSLRKLFDTPIIKRHTAHHPPLGIIFYAAEWNVRCASDQFAEMRVDDDITLCGKTIRHNNRTATIALTLHINNESYVLTVDHLFNPSNCDGNAETEATIPFTSPALHDLRDLDELTLNESTRHWTENVNYFDFETEEQVIPSVDDETECLLTSSPSRESKQNQELTHSHITVHKHKHSVVNEGNWMSMGSKVDLLDATSIIYDYLDWALIKLYVPAQNAAAASPKNVVGRPNVLFLGEHDTPCFLVDMVRERLDGIVRVLVATANAGIREGQLLPTAAYIGHLSYTNMTQGYTVVFADQRGIYRAATLGQQLAVTNVWTGIKPGDCGSVVVLKDTPQIFGHVVAAGPLNEAYVVPLRSSIEQMEQSLFSSMCHVTFPTPLEALLDLEKEYSHFDSSWWSKRMESRSVSQQSAALHSAIHRSDATMVQALFVAGLSPNTSVFMETEAGKLVQQPPIHYTATRGPLKIFQILERLSCYSSDDRDDKCRTPLSYAAETRQVGVVEYLRSSDVQRPHVRADINAVDLEGRTPLYYAVAKHVNEIAHLEDKTLEVDVKLTEQSSYRSLQLLLDQTDTDVNLADKNGRTPLSFAAEHGHEIAIRLLLNHPHIDPNMGDRLQKTPLVYAVVHNHVAAVRILLECCHTDPNLRDTDGRTPISYAAERGDKEMLQIILSCKFVDANLSDRIGKTPLNYIEERTKHNLLLKEALYEIVQLLKTRVAVPLQIDSPLQIFTQLQTDARELQKQGRWDAAEKLERQALKIASETLGHDHIDTLVSKSNLAVTYVQLACWTEAENLELQALDALKKVAGPAHPITLASTANLATIYIYQGRLGVAEDLQNQVIETSRKVLGDDHPDTLTSIANLTVIHGYQGRWKEAESMSLRNMEATKRKLGAEHPNTLVTMSNLASTYKHQGRWNETEVLENQVLEVTRRVLGETHPITFRATGSLVATYMRQGRWQEAETLQVKVVESMKRVLGVKHPDSLTSIIDFAVIYKNQGRLHDAEELLIQVVQIRKSCLPDQHLHTLVSMASLAAIYRDQYRWKDAERLEVTIWQNLKTTIGEEHPSTLASMANLAATYRNQGKWKEAEELELQVMKGNVKVFGSQHPDTLTSMANLAATYRVQLHVNKAEKLEKQVVESRKKVLGIAHPDTIASMVNLAVVYSQQQRWNEAEKLLLDVLRNTKEVLGHQHPHILRAMGNLAVIYLKQQRWIEAEIWAVKAMESMIIVYGHHHRDTLTTMSIVSAIYRNQRNQQRLLEAEKLDVQVMDTMKRILGDKHPDTLTSMTNLALTYTYQGRSKDAQLLLGKPMNDLPKGVSNDLAHTLKGIDDMILKYEDERTYKDQIPWNQTEDLENRILHVGV